MIKNFLYLSLTVVAAFLIRTALFQLDKDKISEADETEEVKSFSSRKRAPASNPLKANEKAEIFQPQISSSEKKASDFAPRVEDSPELERGVAGGGEDTSGIVPYAPNNNSQSSSRSRSSHRSPESSHRLANGPEAKPDSPIPFPTPFPTPFPFPEKKPDPKPDAEPTPPVENSTNNSKISCSSNVGGGAYSNPISVALTCTSAAQVEYCISAGACCDPQTSGTLFASNIIIGASDGNYCLSFFGTDTSGDSSAIVQMNFNINNDYPHLEASHEKIFYQTTELAGVSHIASDDFGKVNFGVGVLNLMTNDPGPSGMNVDCDEIVTNYVTFPAPAPVVVLSFFDTSGSLVTSQLDVPLILANLGYGENFITTYITDNNQLAPLTSCSTTKVNLEDFEFFQANISHGDDGTNQVREFSGGFSPYGFFEEEANVYRGPAGESSEDASGQKLESGLFGVFY